MEKLNYYVPEHVESLPRLKAHYRVGIDNAERCVLWKEILATNQAVEQLAPIDEAALIPREDVFIDCQNAKFINQCPSEAQEEIAKKLQVLILHYLQQNPTRTYHPRLIQAAFPFLAIGLSLDDAYRACTCFLKIFLPKFFTEDKKALQSKADLLRLLILYHDPALCYHMDQRGVSPISYVQDWWSVLFFETCTDLTTVLTLWDHIFLAWDPYLYMFISLVLIIRTRDQILTAEGQEIPLLIATTQIGDFTEVSRLVQQALSFSETTPHAFRCQLCSVTHRTPLFFEFLHDHLKTALCLSVGVQDVVNVIKPEKHVNETKSPLIHATAAVEPSTNPAANAQLPPAQNPPTQDSSVPPTTAHTDQNPPAQHHGTEHPHGSAHHTHTRKPSSPDEYPKFAQDVYDCRSLREYNCGHLPGSVHLDPEKLLNRLGVPQYSSKHIALLPRAAQTGDEQGLILRLLQFGIPYVSCISSGYEACHAMFKEGRIYLENHNEAGCFVCTGISPPLSSLASFTFTPSHQPENATQLSSSNSTHHQNQTHQSDKQYGISSFFGGSGKLTQKMKESFVSGSKKFAENVGNINIKNILPKTEKADKPLNDEEVDISALDSSDYRSLQEWMMYDSNEQFTCKKVKKDGTLVDRRLILSKTELIILEVNPNNPNYVRIKKTYPLSQLSQITYKKSTPKNLHFKIEVPPPPSSLSSSFPSSSSPPLSPENVDDPTPALLPSLIPEHSSSSSLIPPPSSSTSSSSHLQHSTTTTTSSSSPPSSPSLLPSTPPRTPSAADTSSDFQEIALSPYGPPLPPPSSSLPQPHPPSSSLPLPSPSSTLKVKTFFVEEPKPLIAAVHRKFIIL